MQIVPCFPAPVQNSSIACGPAPDGTRPHINPHDYVKVYNSIPFRRSEYIANPQYRNEATMEILTGQLQPKVAAPPQPRPHHTLFPYENALLAPNSYYSYWMNRVAPQYGAAFASGLTPYAPDDGSDYHIFYPQEPLYYPPY